ncbi:MAG: rod shape-determining protein MreC [Candidatus Nomurabacteria bacterium]|nr:rod shape-determining protein MreC [Candidatus Nomurabacteria bacterium]
MSYPSRNNRQTPPFERWVLILAGLFVVVMLIFATGLFGVLQRGLQRGARSVWIAREYSLANARDLITLTTESKQSLIHEIESLRLLNKNLSLDKTRLRLLEQENKTLRETLGRRDKSKETILALVIAPPRQSSYDTILIDRGTSDGIKIGDRVVAYGDMALGTIAEVTGTTAMVQLYSSPDTPLSGRLSGNQTLIDLNGRGGGNFIFEVPRDIEIVEGDIITPVFNSRQIIGIVGGLDFDPRDPFQTVYVTAPFNINQLQFVEIEK